MKTWRPLAAGDIVDIVAPGARTSAEELEAALEFLRQLKLVPRVPKKIYGKDTICSNSRQMRLQFLREALLSTDSRAVWCMRGGYGSIQLMPELRKLRSPKHTKLFIGFSDITTLHLFLNQNWGWSTIHGPMLGFLGRGQPTRFVREIKNLIFGSEKQIIFKGLRPMNEAARRAHQLRGEVVGGNLLTVESSLATPEQFRSAGKILFFEEVNERAYRLDRMLHHLQQAGVFAKAKAVVLGDFLHALEPNGSNPGPKVLKEFMSQLKIPVVSGIACGHGAIVRPVPFGTPSVLRLGSRAELICASGASV